MKFYIAICVIAALTGTYGQFELSHFSEAISMEQLNAKCIQNSGNENILFDIMHSLEGIGKSFGSLLEQIDGAKIGEAVTSQDRLRIQSAIKNQCEKRSLAFGLVKRFAKTIQLCMDPNEIESVNTIVRGIKKLMVFLCENDGANLSEFFMNEGFQCIFENKVKIEGCVSNIPSTLLSLTTLSVNPIEYEQCREYDAMNRCIYDALENCHYDYPATYAENLLSAIKSELPC